MRSVPQFDAVHRPRQQAVAAQMVSKMGTRRRHLLLAMEMAALVLSPRSIRVALEQAAQRAFQQARAEALPQRGEDIRQQDEGS